ncbi:MAG: hypothetical protein WCO54_05875 [Bacteroidota bacterium]
MKNNIIISVFLLILISGVSCTKEYLSLTGPVVERNPNAEVTFKTDIIPIFTKNCLGSGCHITGGVNPNLMADKAYDQLVNGAFINPDDTSATNSLLYQKMTTAAKIMPPPPTAKLSSGDLKLFSDWIKKGSQNN